MFNYKNIGYIDDTGKLVVMQVLDTKKNAVDALKFLGVCAGVCATAAVADIIYKKIKSNKKKQEDKKPSNFKKFKYDKFEYDKFEPNKD